MVGGHNGVRFFGPAGDMGKSGGPGPVVDGGGGLGIKNGFQQGLNHPGAIDRVSSGAPPTLSARYPPLEHLQNPPQLDPKVILTGCPSPPKLSSSLRYHYALNHMLHPDTNGALDHSSRFFL